MSFTNQFRAVSLSLVNQYGVMATYRSADSRNVASGWDRDGRTVSRFTVRIMFDEYNHTTGEGVVRQRYNATVIMPYYDGLTPVPGDEIAVGEDSYIVVSVDRSAPNGQTIAWTLGVSV